MGIDILHAIFVTLRTLQWAVEDSDADTGEHNEAADDDS